MKLEVLEKSVEIPQGVVLSYDHFILTIKGPKGEVRRKLLPRLKVIVDGSNVKLQIHDVKRKEKRIFFTHLAHLRNMLKGVVLGYNYKLKICSGHFPMSVNVVDNKFVVVKNFLGEKIPRKGVIIEGVRVMIKGEFIDVDGYDLEKVGQTAANIEKATVIKGRDRRIFQDGCYIIEKDGRKI